MQKVIFIAIIIFLSLERWGFCPLAPIPSSSMDGGEPNLCQDHPLTIDRKSFRSYEVSISSAGDQDCHMIDIKKNGKLVYHDEEIGGHFYFGTRFEKGDSPWVRLTGRETPEL